MFSEIKFLTTVILVKLPTTRSNDGDIRRALLKGKNLNTKISQVYNKRPVILKKNFNKKIALKNFKIKQIDQAPIVDKKKL